MKKLILDARNCFFKVVPHKLSFCDWDRLYKDFIEEFFSALNSMRNGKSLGIGGLSCEFYKTMWGIVGDDFRTIEHEVFSSGTLSEFPNQGLIKIILKNCTRDTISGCHPITLLDLSYKIMEKSLAIKV